MFVPDEDPEGETEAVRERLSFTLKQLIRKIHIKKPVEHVMCLIGKRYVAKTHFIEEVITSHNLAHARLILRGTLSTAHNVA